MSCFPIQKSKNPSLISPTASSSSSSSSSTVDVKQLLEKNESKKFAIEEEAIVKEQRKNMIKKFIESIYYYKRNYITLLINEIKSSLKHEFEESNYTFRLTPEGCGWVVTLPRHSLNCCKYCADCNREFYKTVVVNVDQQDAVNYDPVYKSESTIASGEVLRDYIDYYQYFQTGVFRNWYEIQLKENLLDFGLIHTTIVHYLQKKEIIECVKNARNRHNDYVTCHKDILPNVLDQFRDQAKFEIIKIENNGGYLINCAKKETK